MSSKRSSPGRIKPPFKRGDVVYVISGDDKGKTGKVLQVFPERGMALVEGINLVKKHLRKSQEHPKGAIITREAPIRLCKLKLYDPNRAASAGKTH
jgi:large subunit ribosomal protein L24